MNRWASWLACVVVAAGAASVAADDPPAKRKHPGYTTREDLIPEFRDYAEALAGLASPAERDEGPLDPQALFPLSTRDALAWVARHIGGHRPQTLYDALLEALPFILLMFLLSRWSGGLVDRFGAKRPLIVGPIIAATGFLLFMLPSIGGSYWTTFFPGFVVLGLGMAVSVAPLTTVVMGAVEQNHAGTASGINNAVARVAGLLAIAILGMVVVSAFSHYMNHRLKELSIPVDAVHEVQSNETSLAAVTVPVGIDPSTAAILRISIERAFVFGFRRIMLVCAALAAASSVFAWCMITASPRR